MMMKRKVQLLLMLIGVISLMCVLTVSVSAATTVYVGSTIEVEKPPVGTSDDLMKHDSSLSDETVAQFVSTANPLVIKFLKPGTVKLTVDYMLWEPNTPVQTGNCFTKTYEVKNPDKIIQETTIKLSSDAFRGGQTFPEFTVPSDADYYVEEATFYKEMVDYYVGDKLPIYGAGTTISNVVVTLKPKSGYFFAWGGSNDGKSHESNVYTVEYKGKTYKPYVIHDYANNKMTVYLDVTYEKGEIYATTFSNLDAPYHNGPLDKTVTVNSDVEFVNVQYTMFNKELDVFEKGDNMAIAVRVKSKNPNNTFNKDGYAYWSERGVKSDVTLIISPTEAVYVFYYTVDALDSQYINEAYFEVEQPTIGNAPADSVISALTEGINVNSVTWTPDDSTVGPETAYTVKIQFSKDSAVLFADDFIENGKVYVNDSPAVLKTEEISQGRFTTTKYYAEYTFPAIPYGEETFRIEAVGDTDVKIYEADQELILEVKVVDHGSEDIIYRWFPCDENGVTGERFPKSNTYKCAISDISAEDMLEPHYYVCKAKVGDTVKSIVFTVTLCPMGVEEEYVFPFTDVKAADWFYSYVEAAHQMGLINGTSATTYEPNAKLTVDAAVKLAVCMNILYNGGNPNTDITIGSDVWYSTYMAYADEHGITDGNLSSRAREQITRSEYVYIFSRALPAEAFPEINTIAVGDIPDVKNCNTAEEKAIYKFYRAGIVLGTDDKGTFKPDDVISRAEVATILIRMMEESFRVKK